MQTFTNPKGNNHIGLAISGQNRRRLCATGVSVTAALLLSACGGGGDSGNSRPPRNFNIGVTIGGQPGGYFPMSANRAYAQTIRAGQSVNLDAGEPVVWNMFIGATQVTYGARVIYEGVTFDTIVLNQNAVTVYTFAPFALQNVVNVTLVATSTYDSVQVATVYLSVVN